jgi:hypothetical protein
MFLDNFDGTPYSFLRADLPTCSLCPVSKGISIRFYQRCHEFFCRQLFHGDGLRTRAYRMYTRSPEGLVGGV